MQYLKPSLEDETIVYHWTNYNTQDARYDFLAQKASSQNNVVGDPQFDLDQTIKAFQRSIRKDIKKRVFAALSAYHCFSYEKCKQLYMEVAQKENVFQQILSCDKKAHVFCLRRIISNIRRVSSCRKASGCRQLCDDHTYEVLFNVRRALID